MEEKLYTFPELIKSIRQEAGLTQVELAKLMEVSPILIAMIESNQREVSKKFIEKLASLLDVHPTSITPFLYAQNNAEIEPSALEKKLLSVGVKLQNYLVKKKASGLRAK
jgi:transcriptional regulator with XRE-family HTH domain